MPKVTVDPAKPPGGCSVTSSTYTAAIEATPASDACALPETSLNAACPKYVAAAGAAAVTGTGSIGRCSIGDGDNCWRTCLRGRDSSAHLLSTTARQCLSIRCYCPVRPPQ